MASKYKRNPHRLLPIKKKEKKKSKEEEKEPLQIREIHIDYYRSRKKKRKNPKKKRKNFYSVPVERPVVEHVSFINTYQSWTTYKSK